MAAYEHLIITCPPHKAADVAARIGDRAKAATGGGRLFGIFAPQIGLRINQLVILREWADAARIPVGAPDLLRDLGTTIDRHEIWDTAPRPEPGHLLAETDGYFSHRWFDCGEADWPRFQELSVTAWENFEDVHATRVIGFWRARPRPAPGAVRVWLMAWYRDLAAWEGSRWYQASPDPAARQSFERFRERRTLTTDSAVSIMRRVA